MTDLRFERGVWQDALRMVTRLPFWTASVLVLPRMDKMLWLDALEQGVYDLILEPLQGEELRRILMNAHVRATIGGSGHFYSTQGAQEAATCAGCFRH
jgi:hypothetical protein